ncbi:MAG: hypothetical protein AB199_02090 [Parcubacteria bacterium C7867-004]|nr:MAG: hypothetical protein AB199_02090 [Parcubacteria bacterium C7867-004]
MQGDRTVIAYHGNCPDGFSGAYAAWKKFGDTAEYLPLAHGKPPATELAGAKVYFIDFCYTKEVMDAIVAEAASVTVLDHHEGVADVVRSMPEYVFDANRSGATIAWTYFHPEVPVPEFLKYVEDGDLYRWKLPDARTVLAYAYTKPFTNENWDMLIEELENPEMRATLLAKGATYAEYRTLIIDSLVERAEPVLFEGMTCYLASAPSIFASDVGNGLYTKHGGVALIAQVRADGLRISLRSNGDINVAEIAQKYGGNGHPGSAGISLPFGSPIPWAPLPDEDTRD